jgi:hypothetical protein
MMPRSDTLPTSFAVTTAAVRWRANSAAIPIAAFCGHGEDLGEEGERFRLPEEYRLEVAGATDEQIVNAVARLMTAYMDSLFFSRDESWEYDSSPYDAFLETNRLPRKADPGQSELYYSRNLLSLVNDLKAPVFVAGTNGVAPPAPGRFKTLSQPFRFGPEELAGMKIFFTRAQDVTEPQRRAAGGDRELHSLPPGTELRTSATIPALRRRSTTAFMDQARSRSWRFPGSKNAMRISICFFRQRRDGREPAVLFCKFQRSLNHATPTWVSGMSSATPNSRACRPRFAIC